MVSPKVGRASSVPVLLAVAFWASTMWKRDCRYVRVTKALGSRSEKVMPSAKKRKEQKER